MSKGASKVGKCRICQGKNIIEFLDLGEMPLPNGFLKKEQLKIKELTYPLAIGYCADCGLVQLMHVVKPELMFKNYVYVPSASGARVENFKQIIHEMTDLSRPSRSSLAIDIGSNDGSMLMEFKKEGIKVLGIDPAENLARLAEMKGVPTVCDYIKPALARKVGVEYGLADYITATNVVAHINDLNGLFSSVRMLLSKRGIFVCEFPYLVDLLDKCLFDTIYHEHLSYFALKPLLKLISKHKLKIVNVKRTPIDGGALRLFLTLDESPYIEGKTVIDNLLKLEKEKGLDDIKTYSNFTFKVKKLGEDLTNMLKKLKENGKTIAGYGASARGNILINYCKIDNSLLDFIVDSTPYKQGLFTPGHKIPIYPEEELLGRKPDYTLILAWNFAKEIMEKQFEYLDQRGKFIVPVPRIKIISRVSKRLEKQKLVVVMPAHNAAKTLVSAYRKLPKDLVDEVILVDDDSQDNTYRVAQKLPIKVFRNSLNLGYGGNLKVCLSKALEAGADIVIEYHPDDQYDPSVLSWFMEKTREGYDFALGSRFVYPKEALKNKMPLTKFIANRAMSYIDELVLGIEMSEFHSGFRMYTRKLLESVPWRQNSDDYLFSFDIIAQAVFWNFKMAEVPISCRYHPAMHTANFRRSMIYALGTFKTLLQYLTAKFLHYQRGPFLLIQPAPCPACREKLTRFESVVTDPVSGKQFSIFFCSVCQNGFTVPTPKDLGKYYPRTYYLPVKSLIYNLLQYRRSGIIKEYKKTGRILDVGCGDGSISMGLPEFSYTGVETSFSGAKGKNILSGGIEKAKLKQKWFDVVTFWESLEHVTNSVEALKKVHQAMKENGVLIIECPNYASGERLLFGSKWFHLDPPRHLSHFTPIGLRHLLERNGFKMLLQKQLYAPEYTPVGLAQSMLYLVSLKLNLVANGDKGKGRFIAVAILMMLLLIVTIPLSVILYWFKASPILLTVAKKV